MVKKLDNAIEDLVKEVVNNYDYQECIRLKELMKNNDEINTLIDNIKDIQKKYVKSCYDSKFKDELDELNDKLNSIPIYYSYNCHLEKVNYIINYIKDDLNTYFFDLLNEYK